MWHSAIRYQIERVIQYYITRYDISPKLALANIVLAVLYYVPGSFAGYALPHIFFVNMHTE